jgi:hypothetical protein
VSATRPQRRLTFCQQLRAHLVVERGVSAAEHPPQSFERTLEDQRIVGWRFEQFRLLGFGDEDAWLLVDSGADLQLTRSLVGAGCPLHLALRIVL